MEQQGQVLEAARRGESDALASLWRTYQPQLLRYLRARRAASPSDVASQVWIDVAGSLARFQGDDDDFRRWLFTIAHRRSVDAVRRSVRRPEVLEAEGSDRVGDESAPADVVYEERTSLERALEMLRSLPPDMAEAVALRVIGELSFADVGEVMGCSDGNARVLAHRGLKRLAAELVVTKPRAAAMEQLQ